MGHKRVLIQLWGFLVKTFTYRWRTPVTTTFELLLPCLFTLLLSIGYWASDVSTIPGQIYDGTDPGTGDTSILMNISNFASYYFCQTPTSTIDTVYYTCPSFSPDNFTCLSLVGSGQDICLGAANYTTLSGILYIMYYGSGPYAVDSMDYYLSLSALATQITLEDGPNFFGRSAKLSLSHFGKLLLASDSAELAASFTSFCHLRSPMCKLVLDTSVVYSSYETAEEYALANDGTVWAILYLPESSIAGGRSVVDPAEFTIGMNYTATGATYTESNRKKAFSNGLGSSDGSDSYILYWASGFMTLQNFVQQYYMERNSNNTALTRTGSAYWTYPAMTSVSESNYLNQYGVGVIPMPAAERWDNSFITKWAYYMPLVAMMAALFPVARLTGLIVEEKSKGVREAMLIMGLFPACNFAGWYASSTVIDFVASLLAAMILKIGFLKVCNYGILLVLYFTFMQQNTALSILMSTIFSNPRVAVWTAAFIVFICGIPFYTFPDGMADIAKLFCCLVPCVGYGQGLGDIIDYATYHSSYTWAISRQGSFNPSIAIGMMWASFGIMMVLAVYLDRVAPAAVGVREHPLFFMKGAFKCFHTQNRKVRMSGRKYTEEEHEPLVEQTEGDANCGGMGAKRDKRNREWIEHYDEVLDPKDETNAAVFANLRKVYIGGGILGFFYTFFTGFFRNGDRVVALDDVTFPMKKGEISVLLGPNGAGKSTIMGIATGIMRSSGGEVYIRGINTHMDIDGCRQHIGYCPQQDIVWSSLTVIEHLRFYARLKDSKTFGVEEAAVRAMHLAGLDEKKYCKAGDLSGGQKRRLCVAIAFVGNSDVLFLDEPTAGMDMRGRRAIYEALQKERRNRSVLISTHLLDEADRIGDRILFINEGNVVAEGSSLFLKSKMKTGYLMSCVLETGLTAEQELDAIGTLSEIVHTHMTAAAREPVAREDGDAAATAAGAAGGAPYGMERRGREVTFRFPLASLTTSSGEIVSEVQGRRAELHVSSVGISLTTLEEVFVQVTNSTSLRQQVAEATAVSMPLVTQRTEMKQLVEENEPKEDDNAMFYEDSGSCMTFCRHFRAMMMKRMHFAKRDFRLLMFQVIIPVAFLLLSLLITLVQGKRQPSLLLDSSMYSDYMTSPSEVMMSSGNSIPALTANVFFVSATVPGTAMGRGYTTKYVQPPTFGFTQTSWNGTYTMSLEMLRDIGNHTNHRYIALSPTNFVYQNGQPRQAAIVMHNATMPHAAPQALNALYSLASYQVWQSQVPPVVARNRPMFFGNFEKDLLEISKQVIIGIFVILPFLFIPCNQISYIVREKETGARHVQWLSGASVAAYWLSSFVFDIACFIITEILAFVIFRIFDRKEFISEKAIGPAIVLFFFYGLMSIPVAYLLSFLFKSPFTAQTCVLLVNFVFGFLWVTVEDMLKDSALNFVRGVTIVLRVVPAVNFAEGIFVLSGNQIAMMYPYAAYKDLWGLLSFKYNASSGSVNLTGGISTGLIYMSSVGVGCTVVLIILEYLRLQRLTTTFSRCCNKKDARDGDEADARDGASSVAVRAGQEGARASVVQEADRVCTAETGAAEDRITVQHLDKRYLGSSRYAVRDVSFGVHEGEILALLGLNGAGKTTTVGVLAGEVMRSDGEAYVNHTPVGTTGSRTFVGYCPQYNPLIDRLSAIEHLYLYARLRGLREEHIQAEVDLLIRELGLYPHRYQAAISLSGGNKRRLSLAVALVGRTTSVLLDEPTAGMDALARAQTCAMVKRLTDRKSVILTTHLLDEVDALSDRVAFMARGRLRCIGTPQEMKVLYSMENTYTLHIVFRNTVDIAGGADSEAIIAALVVYVQQLLDSEPQPQLGEKEVPQCRLKEIHASSVVLTAVGELRVITRALSDIRGGSVKSIPEVIFVSVNQPTLEDILMEL